MEIIHIPKRFSNSDVPPPTRESIAAAREAQQQERDEFDRAMDQELVRALCEKYSYRRVAAWVRNLAAIHGEAV